MAPLVTTSFIARYAGSYRRMKPTWTSRRPTATSASRIRRQASWLVASGFSQKTGLPAARQASTYSSWLGPQDATMTASTSGASTSACPSGWTTARGRSATAAAALSGSTSVTATTSAPARTLLSRSTWSRPIIPVPTTPTRTVISR